MTFSPLWIEINNTLSPKVKTAWENMRLLEDKLGFTEAPAEVASQTIGFVRYNPDGRVWGIANEGCIKLLGPAEVVRVYKNLLLKAIEDFPDYTSAEQKKPNEFLDIFAPRG